MDYYSFDLYYIYICIIYLIGVINIHVILIVV